MCAPRPHSEGCRPRWVVARTGLRPGNAAADRRKAWPPPCTEDTSASRRPKGCSGVPVSARVRVRPSGSRGWASHGAVHHLTHPGRERLNGPEAPRRQRAPARPERRLGPRPALVARPDGPHEAPADRADDARLARLVRHLARRRRPARLMLQPEPALPHARARLVRDAPPRGHARPGDAALAERHRQHARRRRTRTTRAR